ncbi:MAG: hypothetical protein U1F54_14605 [Burkholderiales bacterium]
MGAMLRIAAVPVLAFAFFVAYSHSLPFALALLPTATHVGLGWFIAAAAAITAGLALFWGIVFAFPFAWLYERRAALVAVLCVAPILVVVWTLNIDRQPIALKGWSAAALFFVTLIVTIPTVAHLAYRRLNRHDASSR